MRVLRGRWLSLVWVWGGLCWAMVSHAESGEALKGRRKTNSFQASKVRKASPQKEFVGKERMRERSSEHLATQKASEPREVKRSKKSVLPLWQRGFVLSGNFGSWAGHPQFGIRGGVPLSSYFSVRLSWSLVFFLEAEPRLHFSTFSFEFQVLLPQLVESLRSYAVTRLDFWPLWNPLGLNPNVATISEKPAFGMSILLGTEVFLIQGVSLYIETGFSSGMVFGLGPVKRQGLFGFLLQSGMQMYF